jgi:hypothetical protein
MGNDDDLGGLKDFAKRRHELALCRAIQTLSPVGGPFFAEAAGLMPGRPAAAIDEDLVEGSRQDDI